MLFTGLTLIFVMSKLLGVIDWSWLLCFCPIIVYVIFLFFVFVIYLMKIHKEDKKFEKMIEEKLKDDCK
ncbi:MAG: transmembrane Fragile-X-F protein [Clostridiales bacterium]|nr:transmembrane Fragile-X-F protein [Clostridiales bacterium]